MRDRLVRPHGAKRGEMIVLAISEEQWKTVAAALVQPVMEHTANLMLTREILGSVHKAMTEVDLGKMNNVYWGREDVTTQKQLGYGKAVADILSLVKAKEEERDDQVG